jgi:hypothetical protein
MHFQSSERSRGIEKQQQKYESAVPLLDKPENSFLSKTKMSHAGISWEFSLVILKLMLKMIQWATGKKSDQVSLCQWTNKGEVRYKMLVEKQITLADTTIQWQHDLGNRGSLPLQTRPKNAPRNEKGVVWPRCCWINKLEQKFHLHLHPVFTFWKTKQEILNKLSKRTKCHS